MSSITFSFVIVAILAQFLVGFIVAATVGSERKIGQQWSFILCVLTPFIFGLLLTSFSPKVLSPVNNTSVKQQRGSTENAFLYSFIVLSALWCIWGFNFNPIIGFTGGISTLVLLAYSFDLSLNDTIQTVLIVAFALCCLYALKYFTFR